MTTSPCTCYLKDLDGEDREVAVREFGHTSDCPKGRPLYLAHGGAQGHETA